MAGRSLRNRGSKKRRARNRREEPVKNATAMADDDHIDIEQLKEATRTALILYSMQHDELDLENATKLLEMRERVANKAKTKANSLPKNQPERLMGEEDLGRDVIEQRQIAQIPILGPIELELPPFGFSIDGTELPTIPPVKSLSDKIGDCSRPFEKQLKRNDVSDRRGGLSFNNDIIREANLPMLGEDTEKLARGIPVTAYDSKGNSYQMLFKSRANLEGYALTGGWTKFFVDHGLKEYQDWVSVWMFRHKRTDKICFFLSFRRFPIHSSMGKKRSKAKGIKIKG